MSYARARFLAALLAAITGAVLGVGAFMFSPVTERWLALGVGAAVLITVAAAFAVRGRGTIQRILDPPLALVCAWTIVCGRVVESSGAGASPDAVKWFNFAAGAAIASFGLLGLLLHERGVERDLALAAKRRGRRPGSSLLDEAGTKQLDDGACEAGERRYTDAISRTAG